MEKTKIVRTRSNRPQVMPEMADLPVSTRGTVSYNASYVPKILLLTKLGHSNEEIETILGISNRTLKRWLVKHPKFQDAYDQGKAIFDYGVQDTLLQRAMGYEYKEVKIVEGVDAKGNTYNYTTTSIKVMPPDVTAQIFWLKNRHRSHWADVNKRETTLSLDVNNTLKMEGLSAEEQKLVKSIAVKNLARANDAPKKDE